MIVPVFISIRENSNRHTTKNQNRGAQKRIKLPPVRNSLNPPSDLAKRGKFNDSAKMVATST
jgi:hypothetical protein